MCSVSSCAGLRPGLAVIGPQQKPGLLELFTAVISWPILCVGSSKQKERIIYKANGGAELLNMPRLKRGGI